MLVLPSLVPLYAPIIIYNKPGAPKSWNFHSSKGFGVNPILNHWRYFHFLDGVTNVILISNTVGFLLNYLLQPMVTSGNIIIHALNFLSCAVNDVLVTIHPEKRAAISNPSSPIRYQLLPCYLLIVQLSCLIAMVQDMALQLTIYG